MLTDEEATRVVGATVLTGDGEEIGEVDTVLTHAADNRAAWAAVRAGGRRVLVPLDGAHTHGDTLHVRYGREEIATAPEHSGETITGEQAEGLYAHYGIDDATLRDHHGLPTDEGGGAQGTSRDPRGGGGASDATQGHP